MTDSTKKETQSHPFIKQEGKIKALKGAASLFFKGIKKGSETSVDKNGVAGSWKDNMAGGKNG